MPGGLGHTEAASRLACASPDAGKSRGPERNKINSLFACLFFSLSLLSHNQLTLDRLPDAVPTQQQPYATGRMLPQPSHSDLRRQFLAHF